MTALASGNAREVLVSFVAPVLQANVPPAPRPLEIPALVALTPTELIVARPKSPLLPLEELASLFVSLALQLTLSSARMRLPSGRALVVPPSYVADALQGSASPATLPLGTPAWVARPPSESTVGTAFQLMMSLSFFHPSMLLPLIQAPLLLLVKPAVKPTLSFAKMARPSGNALAAPALLWADVLRANVPLAVLPPEILA
jgi:hypothetical protein